LDHINHSNSGSLSRQSFQPSLNGSIIDENAQLESCSSTKLLGHIFLSSSEVARIKVTISNLFFEVLEIQELEPDEENPAPNGFAWDSSKEKPIIEKRNGKESVVKYATVPTLVFILATSGMTTGMMNEDNLNDYRS
jgi:hypothetical protein